MYLLPSLCQSLTKSVKRKLHALDYQMGCWVWDVNYPTNEPATSKNIFEACSPRRDLYVIRSLVSLLLRPPGGFPGALKKIRKGSLKACPPRGQLKHSLSDAIPTLIPYITASPAAPVTKTLSAADPATAIITILIITIITTTARPTRLTARTVAAATMTKTLLFRPAPLLL
jgi:hypothetical protein